MARTPDDVFAFWSENAEKVETNQPFAGLVSDDEIAAMTADVPQILQDSLIWAFFGLERVLQRNPHITETWRELVAAYRADTTATHDVGVFKFPDGEIIEITLLFDCSSGFRYKAIDDAVARLVSALDEIEKFDPEKYKSKLVDSSYQSIRAQRGRSRETDDESIRREAQTLGYFDLPSYSRKKAEILDEIITRLGLYQGVGTSKPSQRRHLKRVLGG